MSIQSNLKKVIPQVLRPAKIQKFDPRASKNIAINPDIPPVYTIYEFNTKECEVVVKESLFGFFPTDDEHTRTWINIDGLREEVVESLCTHYDIDHLIVEDILSLGQRAKYDDLDGQIFFLLPMLSWNKSKDTIEIEQLSVIMGQNFLLSFQPDPKRDPFDNARERIKNPTSNIRKRSIDYLCYVLIDAVVDEYYTVINILSEKLDQLEEEIMNRPKKDTIFKINLIKREWMLLKRQISPVRELINALYRMDSPLINNEHKKYYKDIVDHISLASEYIDNYRELTVNLQDLYMNQVNTKMNEVIKILTIVTTLLAPFTVIGSIFGMNFQVIPYAHHQYGFYFLILVMFGVSILMLYYFRKQKWY